MGCPGSAIRGRSTFRVQRAFIVSDFYISRVLSENAQDTHLDIDPNGSQSNGTEQEIADKYNSGSGHSDRTFLLPGTLPPSPEGTFFDMRGTRHLRHLVVE